MTQFEIAWLVLDVIAVLSLAMPRLGGSRGGDLWLVVAAHLLAGALIAAHLYGPREIGFLTLAGAYSVFPVAYSIVNLRYRGKLLPDAFVAILVGAGTLVYWAGGMAGFVLMAAGYAAVVADLLLKSLFLPELRRKPQ